MVSIETKDSKSYLSKATVCASKNKPFFFGGVTWKTTISHKVREYLLQVPNARKGTPTKVVPTKTRRLSYQGGSPIM